MENEYKQIDPELVTRYKLFMEFAFNDQHQYYEHRIQRNRAAARGVNRIRAFFALLTGASSALAALIITSAQQPCTSEAGMCSTMQSLIPFLPLLPLISVIAPALGAGFTSLADLFQWERTLALYKTALDNLEVADALSPVPDPAMTDQKFFDDLRNYAAGTLKVMRDESGQWGDLITTPRQLQKFVAEAMAASAASQAAITSPQDEEPASTGQPDSTEPPEELPKG
jgi:hypothetical protein